ncbi:hypothetical protein ACJRO7_016915 [Eucalyptus globulus]|uniref:Uncharacterized protein n=1 Tax=Eucalyptus globulus TaxID=34317 RepID=A0ABD3KUT4_EUCGL
MLSAAITSRSWPTQKGRSGVVASPTVAATSTSPRRPFAPLKDAVKHPSQRLKMLDSSISSIYQNVSASQLNRCARAFVMDDRSFEISNWTLSRFEDVATPQALLWTDWT